MTNGLCFAPFPATTSIMGSLSYSASASEAPTPFWNRIPRFFMFPFQPAILGRICLFAAIPAIGAFTTSMGTILIAAGGLSLVAWILFLRYGCRILSETSRGHLSPADYDQEIDAGLGHLPYSMFGFVFITSMFVGLLTYFFGETAGMGANLVVMAMTPAAMMVMVHTRSLWNALSPAQSWGLIGSIGKSYWLLCLFLFCLSSAQFYLSFLLYMQGVNSLLERWQEIQGLFQNIQSEDEFEQAQAALEGFGNFLRQQRPRLAMSIFATNGAAMFFTMIAFNMMGYVLYQYHHVLGIEVDDRPRGRSGRPQEPRDEDADRIAALIAAGDVNRALDIAYEAQRLDLENIPAQERYHKLLHLAGKTERMLVHANRLIALLLRRQMPGKALEAWRRCREMDAEFRPEDPATILALAQAARAAREQKLALEIVKAFDKKHPRHPLIPEIYLLSATILCEDLRQDAMADRIFAAILARFPDHPCATKAAEYRATLARMQPQAGAT